MWSYLDILRWVRGSYVSVLKWNPSQRRNPAGSSEGGGRWAKGGGSASMYGRRVLPSPTELEQMPQGLPKVRAHARQAGREGLASRERREERQAHEAEAFRRGGGVAGYASIMNAPTGTGFKNRPKAVGFTPPPPELPKPSEASIKTLEALSKETVKDSRALGGGANASMIVTLESGVEAVYKPEVGENWDASFVNDDISRFVTNKDFSLAGREAFAYEAGEKLFGSDNPVPETVLRETVEGVDVPGSAYTGEGSGFASYDLQEMYDEYKQKAQEDAMEAVGGEMGDLYREGQKEHFEDIERRAEEIMEIWNEEIKDFPDEGPYGSGSAVREHAVLPMGSKEPFERKVPSGEILDPMEILDEANVDVSYKMNDEEKKRVRALIREKLEEGAQELGDVDEEKAREHLDYDRWLEAHADTEMRLLDEKIKSFSDWKESRGYHGIGSGGGEAPANPDAPHPNGGSFQHFRGNAESYGSMTPADATRMAVLDYVVGTMDRHGQNLMFENDRPIAIDNGYSMPAVSGSRVPDGFTFRSVGVDEFMAMEESKNVPEEVRSPILESLRTTDWERMMDRHPGMNALERKAFLGRVEKMKLALANGTDLYRLWRTLQRI